MKTAARLLAIILLSAPALAEPPASTPGPAQPVIVENEPTVTIGNQPTVDIGNQPTVNIGNQPTVDIGSVVDVDALITNDSVPVEVLNDRLDVRVDPRTRAYVLDIFAIGTPGFDDTQSTTVPFDSYVAGVNFSVRARNTRGCRLRVQYPDDQGPVRPGGSETDVVAVGNILVAEDPSLEDVFDSKYVPVPHMFVGANVDLEMVASVAVPSNPSSTSCFATAYVYLVPASTGITPGGIGLDTP